MPAQDMPAAEVAIDEGLVRQLLEDQHPDLAGLELVAVGHGWDNAMFRLGDDLVVRLPRRAVAAPLIEHEQRWLPELAPTLPLPIPAPVRVGRPGARFPWAWSVCPWLAGRSALDAPVADPIEAATTLGHFVAALHRPAPPGAPDNPYRAVPLADRDETVLDRITQLANQVDGSRLRTLWARAVARPRWATAPVWVHGDLHPGNLLVRDGHLHAVVDFGDLTAGDPASDLSVAWMLLPAPARPAFRAAADPQGRLDEHCWARAHGWGLAYAVMLMASSANNPAYAALGHRTLDAVLADEPQT